MCYFFSLEPASHLCGRHRHRSFCYNDTTQITVLMFVWYCLVLIQYSYYCDFFCLGPASHLRNRHRHVLVRHIATTKIMAASMALLILSIDLQRICYFIMFYFKRTNGTMVKWWMVKWCYGELKNRTGHLFSHKYWICSFFNFWAQHFCSRQSNPWFSLSGH